MILVIQRVHRSAVTVDKKVVASIGQGLLALVGIHKDDTEKDRDFILNKLLKMRLFPNGNKPIGRTVEDIDGELLLVSQFTLCADCSKGNRPSFSEAMPPDEAKQFYETFVQVCSQRYPKTKSGIFGAMMDVELVNFGPVTIILDSKTHLSK